MVTQGVPATWAFFVCLRIECGHPRILAQRTCEHVAISADAQRKYHHAWQTRSKWRNTIAYAHAGIWHHAVFVCRSFWQEWSPGLRACCCIQRERKCAQAERTRVCCAMAPRTVWNGKKATKRGTERQKATKRGSKRQKGNKKRQQKTIITFALYWISPLRKCFLPRGERLCCCSAHR